MLTCPVAVRLWMIALARVELDKEVIALAMRLLDHVRTRDRC
jgi:hypothetical protein